MKKLITALTFSALAYANTASAGLITSSGDAALTGATVINFDSQPTFSFDTLTIGDVTFTNLASGDLRIRPWSSYGASGQALDTGATGAPNTIQIDFATAVSAFAMNWGAANPDWNVSLYNATNALIDTVVFPGGSGATGGASFTEFFGATGAGITKVIMQTTSGFDYVIIDNFQFVAGSAPVPAPAALGMLGLGLIGLGMRRRAV